MGGIPMSEQHWKIIHNNRNITSNTPNELWENAVRYFQWCDDNPIKNKVTILAGKEAGNKVSTEKLRPYTIKALCIHCNIDEDYIKDIRATKKTDSEYYIVVSKILYIIYTQNLENAMVENFNPGFTAKVLNMEKEEQTMQPLTINHVYNNPLDGKSLPELSDSENSVLEKLELELSLDEKSKEQNS